jgi:cysteine synthase A
MFRSNQEHWGPSGAESPVGGILEAIGETPLIRLERYSERPEIEVWAKLESSNPAASSKDRSALRLITDALESGHIGPETTVIESTSGNLGVGLAQACRYLGLRLICVVDSRTHAINLKTMRALGAEVRVVDRKSAGDRDLLAARLDLVREILTEIPDSYWPNQYENPSSAAAHAEGTMREIDEDLEGRIDYLFVATSTTGTLRGCCDYLARHQRETKVVAVDAQGSALFGGEPGRRRLPGFGAGVATELSKGSWFDRLVRVSDLECVVGCRRLVDREAVLAGASAGGVASAFDAVAPAIESGARCALLFADDGRGYLDTVFSDEWVERELGVSRTQLAELVLGPSGRVRV